MTTPIELSSEITVKLVRASAQDDFVVQAAQVSSKGENKPGTEVSRLINALMKGRHGTPFEHNSMTFFIEAPIFVFREWHRHRIASINEMSGRYTELLPKFYSPAANRPMVNIGTKMQPQMIEAKLDVVNRLHEGDLHAAKAAWYEYQRRLDMGVANEIARIVLPVSIYSQMYWTVNARSLMNFLSLRVESENSLVRSYPQLEIQMGADQIETIFAELMPATHAAFIHNGRVAP